MKFAILALSLFSTALWAKPVNVQVDPSSITPMSATASAPATPIRMAKMEGVLKKSWNEKQADGSYKTSEVDVCRFIDQAPVFEVEEDSFNYSNPKVVTCKTDLKVGPSTVSIFSLVILAPNATDPIYPGKKSPFKGFGSGFWVQNDKGDFMKIGPIAISVVDDLNLKSMTTFSFSNQLTANGAGDTILDENLSLTVRIVD